MDISNLNDLQKEAEAIVRDYMPKGKWEGDVIPKTIVQMAQHSIVQAINSKKNYQNKEEQEILWNKLNILETYNQEMPKKPWHFEWSSSMPKVPEWGHKDSAAKSPETTQKSPKAEAKKLLEEIGKLSSSEITAALIEKNISADVAEKALNRPAVRNGDYRMFKSCLHDYITNELHATLKEVSMKDSTYIKVVPQTEIGVAEITHIPPDKKQRELNG